MRKRTTAALLTLLLAACGGAPPKPLPIPKDAVPRQFPPPNTVTDTPSPVPASPFAPGRPLAHVSMVQWVSPLVWRSYPVQWNLLFHMDVAKRNKIDDYNDPAGTVPGFLLGGPGFAPWAPLRSMISGVLLPAQMRLVDDSRWFYTVTGPQLRWYDQRVFVGAPKARIGVALDDQFWRRFAPDAFPISRLTAPDTAHLAWVNEQKVASGNRLSAEWIGRWVAKEIYGIASGRNPRFNPKDSYPTVTVDVGERATAFWSLARSLRFLEANPQKPAWIINFDAPDHPAKWQQPNENVVWFVLTHPGFNTHPFPRQPLASIYAPQQVYLKDVNGSRVAAHRRAIGAALDAAGVKADQIGRFITDAGQGVESIEPSRAMLQALGELGSSEPLAPRLYDIERYIRNPGAVAAGLNMAFAVAYAHHSGEPVLVVSTREAEAVHAVVITAAPGQVPYRPEQWPRARSAAFANFPWWGDLVERR